MSLNELLSVLLDSVSKVGVFDHLIKWEARSDLIHEGLTYPPWLEDRVGLNAPLLDQLLAHLVNVEQLIETCRCAREDPEEALEEWDRALQIVDDGRRVTYVVFLTRGARYRVEERGAVA